MAEPQREPDAEPPPRMPRWVKVAGIIVGALILLVAVLALTGVGGDHGPGRHTSSGDASQVVLASGDR